MYGMPIMHRIGSRSHRQWMYNSNGETRRIGDASERNSLLAVGGWDEHKRRVRVEVTTVSARLVFSIPDPSGVVRKPTPLSILGEATTVVRDGKEWEVVRANNLSGLLRKGVVYNSKTSSHPGDRLVANAWDRLIAEGYIVDDSGYGAIQPKFCQDLEKSRKALGTALFEYLQTTYREDLRRGIFFLNGDFDAYSMPLLIQANGDLTVKEGAKIQETGIKLALFLRDKFDLRLYFVSYSPEQGFIFGRPKIGEREIEEYDRICPPRPIVDTVRRYWDAEW